MSPAVYASIMDSSRDRREGMGSRSAPFTLTVMGTSPSKRKRIISQAASGCSQKEVSATASFMSARIPAPLRRMGVGRLITQVGQDTGAPREAQHESIVAALRAARPILEDSGVTIMIEPLNTLVDHKGYYLWSAVEGARIVREADHPLVRLIFDIYHQQIMEGNIIPNITQNLDIIAHLHAAGHPGRHEMQRGESDYRVIFDAVDAAGYTGACGLEYTPLMEPEESLRVAKSLYGKAEKGL